jgi:hypothetical protein
VEHAVREGVGDPIGLHDRVRDPHGDPIGLRQPPALGIGIGRKFTYNRCAEFIYSLQRSRNALADAERSTDHIFRFRLKYYLSRPASNVNHPTSASERTGRSVPALTSGPLV